MVELSEKLKLTCELIAYTSVYTQLTLDPITPFSQEGGKKMTEKVQKACKAYMENFITKQQDVPFKDFIKEWAVKASSLWDDVKDLTNYTLKNVYIECNINSYMAKLIIEELKKNLSKDKIDEMYSLYKYSSGKYSLIAYKELSLEQIRLYEKSSVGITNANWLALYEEYIKYLSATTYLTNEELRIDLVKSLMSSMQISFPIKMKEKEIEQMAERIYNEVINAQDIKEYILDKFNYLLKQMRYQMSAIKRLFGFMYIIFRPEREIIDRGKELAESLIEIVFKDELISSDKELMDIYTERIFAKRPSYMKIRVVEPDKDWDEKTEFATVEDVPYGNRKFIYTMDFNGINQRKPNEVKTFTEKEQPLEQKQKNIEDKKSEITDGSLMVGDRQIKLSDATLELLGLKPKVEEKTNVKETTYQKPKIQEIDIPEEEVRDEIKEILVGIRRRDENYVKFDKANADMFCQCINLDGLNEYECYLLIKELMNQGVGINDFGESGTTPLHLAAKTCRNCIFEFLIKNGADVNARDHSSQTPLHAAAFAMNKEAIDMLLDNEADINAQDSRGFTPLITAYMWLHTEKQKPLSERSKEIEAASAYIMEHLIKKGSDLTLKVKQFDNMPIALMLKILMDGFED